jgi:hypothetical protein
MKAKRPAAIRGNSKQYYRAGLGYRKCRDGFAALAVDGEIPEILDLHYGKRF